MNASLRERLAISDSRMAMKQLAQLKSGQKLLKASRLLAAIPAMGDSEGSVRTVALEALDLIVKSLSKHHGILASHLLPAEAVGAAGDADLPFEEEPSEGHEL